MAKIGIVGHADDKFTPHTEAIAQAIIAHVLHKDDTLVSGGCHLGGIDIFAEKYADAHGIPKIIHYPKKNQWSGGYRERNLKIARDSDEVHVIVVSEYPLTYKGRRFKLCYHCKTSNHVKSGGCWTGVKAKEMDKPVYWHIII